MNIGIPCSIKACVLLRVPVASDIGEIHTGVHVLLSNDEDDTYEVAVPKLDVN
jgi:hypothetical protein